METKQIKNNIVELIRTSLGKNNTLGKQVSEIDISLGTEAIQEKTNNILDKINKILSDMTNYEYSNSIIFFLILFYAGFVAPKLPVATLEYLEYPVFRLLLIVYLLYLIKNKNYKFVVIIISLYLTTLYVLSNNVVKNEVNNIKNNNKTLEKLYDMSSSSDSENELDENDDIDENDDNNKDNKKNDQNDQNDKYKKLTDEIKMLNEQNKELINDKLRLENKMTDNFTLIQKKLDENKKMIKKNNIDLHKFQENKLIVIDKSDENVNLSETKQVVENRISENNKNIIVDKIIKKQIVNEKIIENKTKLPIIVKPKTVKSKIDLDKIDELSDKFSDDLSNKNEMIMGYDQEQSYAMV